MAFRCETFSRPPLRKRGRRSETHPRQQPPSCPDSGISMEIFPGETYGNISGDFFAGDSAGDLALFSYEKIMGISSMGIFKFDGKIIGD